MPSTTLAGIPNLDRRNFLRRTALVLAAAPFVLPTAGEALAVNSRTPSMSKTTAVTPVTVVLVHGALPTLPVGAV